MITFRQKGDFSKTTKYFAKLRELKKTSILNRYGEKGVVALSSATPVDSGKTAASWYYKLEQSDGSDSVVFYNSNENKGVQIAIILQYGHGTGTGGWVEGRDYINPTIAPLFSEMANELWKEVTKL